MPMSFCDSADDERAINSGGIGFGFQCKAVREHRGCQDEGNSA